MENDNLKNESNVLYTLLAAVNSVVGKTVRVIKEDKLDDACNIADELRWHIGDKFQVCKVEILPWGCFLYNKEGQNLNVKRAELVV